MKLKKIMAGILAAAVAASSMAIPSFGNGLVPTEGSPDLSSTSSMWLLPVYRVEDTENNISKVDFGVDLTKVTGLSFTVEVVENKENFEGNIGGGLVFSCSGGDIDEDEDLLSKYNWSFKSFWGVNDEELNINASDKSSVVVGEKVGSYTYRFSANGYLNPLVEDDVKEIGCINVALHEWGIDPAVIAVKECNILDKDGNILLSFDGQGNQKDSSDEPIIVPEYRYNELDSDTIEITRYTGSATSVEIPSDIDGKTVTGIGAFAFKENNTLQSVVIPDGVTNIGYAAFNNCSALQTVTIPDSVTSIINDAFTGTPILKNNTDKVRYIGNWLIEADKDITSIEIKDETVGIADCALSGCGALTSITIPDSVTSIGNAAFSCCASLTDINVGNDNTAYKSEDGIVFDKSGETLVAVPAGKTGEYVIPDDVTTIINGTFEGCSGLTAITIPESVTSIGTWAFSGCSSIKSITIPNGITSIGE